MYTQTPLMMHTRPASTVHHHTEKTQHLHLTTLIGINCPRVQFFSKVSYHCVSLAVHSMVIEDEEIQKHNIDTTNALIVEG